MGDFVIRVHAVGGHGHHREVKNGEIVPTTCEAPEYCIDCLTHKFVADLKRMADVKNASLSHWPAELAGYSPEGEVRDDLVTGKRRGNF